MATAAVSPLPKLRPRPKEVDVDRPKIVHIRLGDTDVSLCGRKLKGKASSPEHDKCIVCLELAQQDRFYTR